IAVFLLGFAQRFLDLGGLELRLRLREILQKSRAAQLDEDVVGSDELPRENVHVLDDAFAAIGYGADFRRVQGARAGDLVHELPARDAPGPERAAVDAGRTPHEARGHAREEGERDAGGGESRPAAIAALARIRSLDIRGLPPERRSPSRLPMLGIALVTGIKNTSNCIRCRGRGYRNLGDDGSAGGDCACPRRTPRTSAEM